MAISRGTRAICGTTQTAMSYKPAEGASLLLKLQEMERDCSFRRNSFSYSFLIRNLTFETLSFISLNVIINIKYINSSQRTICNIDKLHIQCL